MTRPKNKETFIIKNVIGNKEFKSTLDELLSILHFNYEDDLIIGHYSGGYDLQ